MDLPTWDDPSESISVEEFDERLQMAKEIVSIIRNIPEQNRFSKTPTLTFWKAVVIMSQPAKQLRWVRDRLSDEVSGLFYAEDLIKALAGTAFVSASFLGRQTDPTEAGPQRQGFDERLPERGNVTSEARERDGFKCPFTSIANPEGAHIFPFAPGARTSTVNTLNTHFSYIATSFFGPALPTHWKTLITSSASNSNAIWNIISLHRHLHHWWATETAFVLKPFEIEPSQTQPGWVVFRVEFIWLKRQEIVQGGANPTRIKAGAQVSFDDDQFVQQLRVAMTEAMATRAPEPKDPVKRQHKASMNLYDATGQRLESGRIAELHMLSDDANKMRSMLWLQYHVTKLCMLTAASEADLLKEAKRDDDDDDDDASLAVATRRRLDIGSHRRGFSDPE